MNTTLIILVHEQQGNYVLQTRHIAMLDVSLINYLVLKRQAWLTWLHAKVCCHSGNKPWFTLCCWNLQHDAMQSKKKHTQKRVLNHSTLVRIAENKSSFYSSQNIGTRCDAMQSDITGCSQIELGR